MAFSLSADVLISWTIPDFKESIVNATEEKKFYSSTFITSAELNRKWQCVLSVKPCKCHFVCDAMEYNRKIIDVKLICDKIISNPVDIKANISLATDLEGNFFSRSLIISGNEKTFGFDNFIDFDELMQIINNNSEMQIYVEMFLRNKKKCEDWLIIPDSEFLSDVLILCQGKIFFAHKAILARKSRYFYNLFQENSNIKKVNLDIITPEALTSILKYIYLDQWELHVAPCDVMFGASILQINELKYECEYDLQKNITINSVISIFISAIKCDSQVLMKFCLYFILRQFNQLGEAGCFQSLKIEPMAMLEILNEFHRQLTDENIKIVDNITCSFKQKSPNWSDSFDDCASFLNNEIVSDVKIHVDGRNYQCHKAILSARSSVFDKIFSKDEKENAVDKNSIEIDNIKVEVIHEVLRYIYTGKVENLGAYGIEILKAANRFNMTHLKTLCGEFFVEHLADDNVIALVKIANDCNADFLKNHCVYFIVKHMIHAKEKKFGTTQFLWIHLLIIIPIFFTIF